MKHHFAPLDRIRVSKKAQDHLVTLRRRTGLRQWNWVCRWAFCRSIAEPSKPPMVPVPSDSNLEMAWQVFGGEHDDIYAAILRQRCIRDELGAPTPRRLRPSSARTSTGGSGTWWAIRASVRSAT